MPTQQIRENIAAPLTEEQRENQRRALEQYNQPNMAERLKEIQGN